MDNLKTWIFIISLAGLLAFGLVSEASENIVMADGMDLFDVLPPLPNGLSITYLPSKEMGSLSLQEPWFIRTWRHIRL